MKKYFFPFCYTLLIILVGTLISSFLYYFNIIGDKLNRVFLYLIGIVSIFTGCFKLCLSVKQKGYITGLIYFGICFIIMNIFSLFIFKNSFNFNSLIYYLILLAFSIIGGIIGKNKQKETNT